jgi:hypothetical protein
VNGTSACQKSNGQVQVLGLRRLRDPRDMAKAELPEPQSPDDVRKRPSARHLMPTSRPALGMMEGPAPPSGRRAMPNEGIQGDEWGAYVRLGRTTRTNAGSPVGREPRATECP